MTAQAPIVQVNETGKRINLPMQGARGLFCLFVFVYHVYNSSLGTLPFLATPISDFFFRPLQYGVELFFGISGYFIIKTLQRSRSVADFAWDRATRIYPVLWASSFAVLGVALAFHQRLPPLSGIALSFLTAPPFILYSHVNPIAWTLDYETSFYIYCAVCWALRKHTRISWPIMAFPAVAGLLFFPRASMMVAGSALALGLMERPFFRSLARWPGLFLILFLFGWHLVVLACRGKVDALSVIGLPLAYGIFIEAGIAIVCIVGGIALMGILRGHGALSVLLASRFFVFMGAISYSFYLWHIPVMAGVKRILEVAGLGHHAYSQALFFVICLPLSLGLAMASHRLLEVRLTRILRGLGKKNSHVKSLQPEKSAMKPLAYSET